MKFTVLPVHFKKYMEYIENHHSMLIQIRTVSPVFKSSAIFFASGQLLSTLQPVFSIGRRSKGFERISALW